MTGFPISRNPIVRQDDSRQLAATTPRFSERSFFVLDAFDLRTIKVFRAKSARQRREDSDGADERGEE